MSIDHGCLEEFVAEQLLNLPDVISIFKKMCRKIVIQCMNRNLFCYPRLLNCSRSEVLISV